MQDSAPASHSKTLSKILNIRHERGRTYGDAVQNLSIVGNLWDIYLSGRPGGKDVGISGADTCIMMSLLKIGRMATGTAHHDNYCDAANYLIIAGDMTSSNAHGIPGEA